MTKTQKIKELAESLTSFFIVLDGLFLYEEDNEALLTEAAESLEKKVLHNESALPVIMALGGNYDSEIDRAKIEELQALEALIRARKRVREETIKAGRKTETNKETLQALFGL